MGECRLRDILTAARRRALFLDRDGVLNEPVWDLVANAAESPLRTDDVVLCPDASTAVRRAAAAGWPVVIVSNQPAAAKGRILASQLCEVHKRVLALLGHQKATVEASYLCLHHPDGLDPDLGGSCRCRKPAPGLFMQAAEELGLDLSRSWLVGDTDADVGAALNAGLCGVVVVDHPLSKHRRGVSSWHTPEHAATADAAVARVLALAQQ